MQKSYHGATENHKWGACNAGASGGAHRTVTRTRRGAITHLPVWIWGNRKYQSEKEEGKGGR
jgi:hypothetical protein